MILHVDMDAFYASVEQFDNPGLRGKPVIVGGRSKRGVVCAASYEARYCGVHSAMPLFQAKKLCPKAVFMKPRMSRYKQVSKRVMAILAQFSPRVEVVSIDEAYLDVSGCERLHGAPVEIALQIKQEIQNQVGLNCSVGVAPFKFLAKIASNMDKPDGLTEITQKQTQEFIDNLAIEKVPGVGNVIGKSLKEMGIRRLGEARQYSEKALTERLGKFGRRLLVLANARNDTRVISNTSTHSISTETTLSKNTSDREYLKNKLLAHSEIIARQLRSKQLKARIVTLKLKHADFLMVTRRTTLDHPTQSGRTLFRTAKTLLCNYPLKDELRLIGVGASGLVPMDIPIQQDLFSNRPQAGALNPVGSDLKWEKADQVVDDITQKFGKRAIKRGTIVENDET